MRLLWRFKKKREQVNLVGPHPTAQIKKKKRHFEFVETTNDVWKEVAEARFKAFTHSSSFVGNVKYDQDNQTMEIILNGKTYEFCNVSERYLMPLRVQILRVLSSIERLNHSTIVRNK